MKKIIMTLALCGLAGASFAQNLNRELDSVMNAYQKVQHFNGSVLVAKNGRVLLEKGYGCKNFQAKTLNDAHTVYMIASVTKPFTSAVVLKLIAQHQLALNDPLTKFFPNYPNGDKVTIYNLLTHTAGIPNYTLDSVFMATHRGLKVSDALIQYGKSDFAPGTNWKYSNQGYQLLGEIIARVSKMSYFQAVRHYIFQPLHMTHSGFDFAALKSPDKATGYWTYPENGKNREATIIDSAASFSAGAIYSTIGDMYKWHRGLQAYQIVLKALMDQAYTPFKNHYGFGWFIDSLYGKRVLSHSGDTWGFKSNIARVTEDDVCLILLNNIEDEEMRGPLTNDLLAVLYHQPYQLPAYHQEITLDEQILKQYIGTYELAPGLSAVISLDKEGLWVAPGGQQPSRIYAYGKNRFFSKVVDAEVEFITGNDGKVTGLAVTQGGHRMEGKKLN
ncbi:MAG TPA: serine hydrolase [Puia sp.]|nr:serine hydrolase [Puia sp.]